MLYSNHWSQQQNCCGNLWKKPNVALRPSLFANLLPMFSSCNNLCCALKCMCLVRHTVNALWKSASSCLIVPALLCLPRPLLFFLAAFSFYLILSSRSLFPRLLIIHVFSTIFPSVPCSEFIHYISGHCLADPSPSHP